MPIFHLDTNLLNAKQKLPEVNQLEKWIEDEVILIVMSATARGESLAGSNLLRVKKANTHIYTVSDPINESDPLYRRIESCIFPDGAKDENQKNDIRIVCEAEKYQAILITNDGASKSQPGGILGNRDKFSDRIKIMNPMEAVQFVQGHIQQRDQFARQVSLAKGFSLPSWVGID